jgi:hypothetical protein
MEIAWCNIYCDIWRQVDSFFFEKHSTNASAHIHAHTLTPMNAHTHTLPL